jgi:hypothetical protein
MKYNLPFYETAKSEYLSDTDTVRKTFRLAILAEQVIKFHTAVIVQNFLQSKDVRAEGKAYLGRGLSRPSLGLWAFFTEMIFPMIESEDLFWRDFPEYFQSTLKPITGELIPFRNTLHHGPTPSTMTCSTYQEKIFPLIEKLENSGILGRERLVIGELIAGSNTRNIDLISDDGRVLNLTPLLYYKEIAEEEVGESSKYFFYNDMRKSKEKAVGLLNYEIGLREISDIYEEFRKTYPLEDWNTLQFARFQTRIDELTENFQGRTKELGDIQNFLKKGVGSFFVFGGPGMGKSSLLARAITLTLSSMEEKTDYSEEKFEIGENMGVCDYFIRRNTNTSYATTFFQLVGDDLEGIFQTGIQVGNNLDEMKQKWGERLLKIESKLKENKKENEKILKNKKDEKLKPTLLVIFIDGLDEGEDEIIKSIPAKAYEKILFLCSARDHVRQNLSHIESRMEISLGGLHPQEIAGLLRTLTLATKIDELYLKAVVEKSGGSPLYLKMLSDAILRGEIKPGELSNLPKEANEFYEEILGRMKAHPLGEDILKTLFLLTISKDFITGDTIAFFLGTDRHTVEDYLATAKEVLWENPQTEDRLDYQLFHESLRDYILRNFPIELQNVRQTFLLQGIRDWEEIHLLGLDPYTDEYLLKYSITHLLEDKATQKEAEDLVLNPDFLEAQLTTLNFYTVPMNDSKSVLQEIILELGGKVGESKPIEEIFLPKANPEEPFRTTRFVQLVNHTGEVGFRAGNDIGIAWKWVEEGKVSEALERLRPIQDKQRLFDCYILVLWLLTLQEDGENNRINLKLVLEEVEKNIPPGSETVMWHERFSKSFFSDILIVLLKREFELSEIFDRGEDEKNKDLILQIFNYNTIRNLEQYKINIENKKFIDADLFLICLTLSHNLKSSYYKSILLTSMINISFTWENYESFLTKIFKEVNIVTYKIEDNYLRSTALLNLGDCYFKIGRLKIGKRFILKSLNLISSIESSYNRVIIMIKIGESICNTDDNLIRNNIFPQIFDQFNYILNDSDRNKVISDMSNLIIKFGNEELSKNLFLKLLELSKEVKTSYDKINSILDLCEYVSKLNDKSLIYTILVNIISITREVEDSTYRCIILSKLGELLFRLGVNDDGKNLINEAMDCITYDDDSFKSYFLIKNLSEVLEKSDNNYLFHRLISITNNNKDINRKSHSLFLIGISIIKSFKVDDGKILIYQSLELANKLNNSEKESLLALSLFNKVLELNDMTLIKEIYINILNFIKKIKDLDFLSNTIIKIGKSILSLKNNDNWKYLYEDLQALISDIKDNYYIAYIFYNLGEYLFVNQEKTYGKTILMISFEYSQKINVSLKQNKLTYKIGEFFYLFEDSSLGKKLIIESMEINDSINNSTYFPEVIPLIAKMIVLQGDDYIARKIILLLEKQILKISPSSDIFKVITLMAQIIDEIKDKSIAVFIFPKLVNLINIIQVDDHKKI